MEEVHLWRGSAEQRALRRSSRTSERFAYFDRQLGRPEWSGMNVLDFGGNVGTILHDPDCRIRPQSYYCVDVLEEALLEGARNFPEAHWIHYDRYNCSFNPRGVRGLRLPAIRLRFDAVLAYSVFTHTTREDMHDLVGQLRALLAPEGVLCMTFVDPHHRSWPDTYAGTNLRWRLERCREENPAIDVDALLEKARGADWCALVDGTQLVRNGNGLWQGEADRCLTYNVYYTARFLAEEFPGAHIRPPADGDMQHGCILRRDAEPLGSG